MTGFILYIRGVRKQNKITLQGMLKTIDMGIDYHIKASNNSISEVGVIYYTKERSGLIKDSRLGLVHIYYGQGVGKTTRAVGLAIRAAGVDLKVNFIQFMKSGNSGEISIFANIPNIQYQCPGKHPFILSRGPDQVHYEHASEALHYALEAAEEGTQLLICDEILDTLIFGLLKEEQVRDLIEKCKGEIELVMTGADASWSLIELADYVTEYKQIKHAYYAGAKARRGIEY